MILVNLGSQSFSLPESWDDVIRSGRYLEVVHILALMPAGDTVPIRYGVYEQLLHLYADGALEVADIPTQLVPAAATELIDQCYPVLEFIFDKFCTSCPLPTIRHRGITYTGKGENMLPMSGKQMEVCAWAYAEWQKTGNIEMLDKVIVELYTPKYFWIRWLLKLMPSLSRIGTLPSETKLGIKFWYESCEAWWYTMYKSLYESNGQVDAKPDSFVVSRLVRGLAGAKRGIVEQVRLMNRDEIYFELAELNREREASEDRK